MTNTLIILVIVLLVLLGATLILFHRQGLRLNEEIQHVIDSEDIKAKYLVDVSTNFREPLDEIIGRCEAIAQQPCFNQHPEVVEAIEDIKFKSKQLYQYSKEILELSNTQGNIPKSAKIQVNLVELIMSYRREILHEVRDNVQVYIRTELSPHTKVWLNTTVFRQLIMHLLRSAAHNTHTGHITITYITEKDGLRFTIGHTGNEIPEEAEKILMGVEMEEEELENPNVDKDIIISMAICKNIIDKFKGTINVIHSSEHHDHGNAVTFWLPCSVTKD